MGRGQQGDGFESVMPRRRGLGKQMREERERERERERFLKAGAATNDNDFQEALAILLEYRRDRGNKLVQELYEQVSTVAPRVIGECVLGARAVQDPSERFFSPFFYFARFPGLEGEETKLSNPRFKGAVQAALNSALNSRVSTVEGLAKKMCQAWRDALGEMALDSLWADQRKLLLGAPEFAGVGLEHEDVKITDFLDREDVKITDFLDREDVKITDFLDREDVKNLLWPARPIVEFASLSRHGFSVRSNFHRYGVSSDFHRALWPLVAKAIDLARSAKKNQSRESGA